MDARENLQLMCKRFKPLAILALSCEGQVPIGPHDKQPDGSCEILFRVQPCNASKQRSIQGEAEAATRLVAGCIRALRLESMIDTNDALAVTPRVRGVFVSDRLGIH